MTAVSPNPLLYAFVANSDDNGEYLSTTLLTEEITISFVKSITIVNDANVDLFGSYIISVDYDEDDDKFEITFLTYVPNYMALDDSGANKQIVLSSGSSGVNGATYSLNEDTSFQVPCAYSLFFI